MDSGRSHAGDSSKFIDDTDVQKEDAEASSSMRKGFADFVIHDGLDEEVEEDAETIKWCKIWKRALHRMQHGFLNRMYEPGRAALDEELDGEREALKMALENRTGKMALGVAQILSRSDIPVRRKWIARQAREFNAL